MNNSGIFSNDCGPLSQLDFDLPKPYRQGVENHDTSVCVIKDGKIVYANAEERFSLIKHDGRSPRNVLIDIKRHFDDGFINELTEWQKSSYKLKIGHHISHIYEVFYNSGFDEAAVFVNDGCGTERDCITLAYMKRGEEPLILKKFKLDYSLGWLYSAMSNCIFMTDKAANFQEGKLMGLASYGTPIKDLTLIDIVDGEFLWNIKALKEIGVVFALNDELKDLDRCYLNEYPILIQANYAATLQRDFENCSIKAIQLLHSLLKDRGIETKNLCLSGGCILNCPTNSKIIDLGLFEHYYASPNPTDGGVGFGFLYHRLIKEDKQNAFQFKRLESPYLGYNYSYNEIIQDLRFTIDAGNKYRKWFINLEEPPYNLLCSYLADQKILCWYQGGAEFGPRALGHRSLLADPRTFNMNQKLNKIKGREPWRPLAPVVPEELFKDVFEVENTDLCEFMLRTLKIKDKWVPMLKGVCHVDGTARPQLLKKSLNPELYNLLMVWYKKTGCPALINTSLNAAGLPIIERSGQVLEFMHEANSSDLVGVFVGNSTEMTIVPNIKE